MGLRPGWEAKLMTRMMRRKALRCLMETGWHDVDAWDIEDDDDDMGNDDTMTNNKNSYFEYNTEYAVKSDFAAGVPLSGVWMSDGTGRIILKNGKSLEIKLVENTARKVNGLWYHQWNLVQQVCESDKKAGIVPCLFLQERTQENSDREETNYTVIRKDWRLIGCNGICDRFGNT